MLREDLEKASALGIPATYREGYAIKRWDGKPDQRDAASFTEQATFHPTKYLTRVLKWLAKRRTSSATPTPE